MGVGEEIAEDKNLVFFTCSILLVRKPIFSSLWYKLTGVLVEIILKGTRISFDRRG